MESLLTPKQVAKTLSISVRSVYDHAGRLGGFYPAGIKCLRFRAEAINDIMMGQNQEQMRVQAQVQGRASRGRPQKGRKGGPDDPNRYGF